MMENISEKYYKESWKKAPNIQIMFDQNLNVLDLNDIAGELLELDVNTSLNSVLEASNQQFIKDYIQQKNADAVWSGEAVLIGGQGESITVTETLSSCELESGDWIYNFHGVDIRSAKKQENEFYEFQDLLLLINEAEESLVNDDLDNVMNFIFTELSISLQLTNIMLVRNFKNSRSEECISIDYQLQKGWDLMVRPKHFQEIDFLEFGLENWLFQFRGGHAIKGNIKDCKENEKKVFSNLEAKSILALPILGEEGLWGILYLSSESTEKEWSVLEENILKNLANAIGKAFVREEYHRNLMQAKIDAEIMAKSKTEFLSIMSHEIRTPMNAVVGMTHLLLMDDPREDQIEHLKLLNYSSDNLLYLINDILDFNKIDAGKVELEMQAFSVLELCHNLINSLKIKAEERNNELIFVNQLERSFFSEGDPTRLNQVISNLVNNALKFTENGSVQVILSQNEQEKRRNFLRFCIKDSGVGIPKDKQQIIFERFEQASISTTREFGGTGLGLAICKKLVRLFGGRIWVESEMGQGAEFIFSIPLKEVAHETFQEMKRAKEIEPGLLKEKHVLMVEDNAINILLTKKILNRWGCKVVIAKNGQEGVDLFEDGQFDFVLMDLHMPIMGGLEAILKIRLKEKSEPIVPIILFSADAMSGSDLDMVKTGITAFATKPYNPSDLYRQLVELL